MKYSKSPHNLIAVKSLISINVAIFILQAIFRVWFNSNFIESFFALSRPAWASGKIWTLITYSFLHAGFLHILVNMLAIFFIGRILEPAIGSKNILKVYFVSLLLGAISWLLLTHNPQEILVGASAGAFGLMTFFCLLCPNIPMTVLLFFVIPITMKPKWILWAMIALEGFLFLFFELPKHSFIASSGHLGGILGGAIMYQLLIKHRLFSFEKIKIEAPKWIKKLRNPKIAHTKFTLNMTDKEAIRKEVDRILDKINKKGFNSLDERERQTLDKAKNILES